MLTFEPLPFIITPELSSYPGGLRDSFMNETDLVLDWPNDLDPVILQVN